MTAIALAESPIRPSQLPLVQSGDLANLDLLRAVAVGLVLFGHSFACMKIRGCGDLGHFGVLLFFVHTAFVLMGSMERLGVVGSRLYAVFTIRRLFRIYPLSILCVLVVVAFRVPSAPWIHGYAWDGWGTLVSNLLLTQNLTRSTSVNCVLWSLPFEVQMYLLLPLLFLWVIGTRSLWAVGGAWLLAVVIAMAEYLARAGTTDLGFLVTRYAPCFMAGIFAWQFMRFRTPRFRGSQWVLLLVAAVVAYRLTDLLRVYGAGALQFTPRADHQIWWPVYLDLVRDWGFCLATGAAIPLFAQIRAKWLKGFSKTIAQYSYGIYVCHVPILWLCFFSWGIRPRMGALALALALTGVVSAGVYRWIENPAIRFGKRLAGQV